MADTGGPQYDGGTVRARVSVPFFRALVLAGKRLGTRGSGTVRALLEMGLRDLALWPPPEAK